VIELNNEETCKRKASNPYNSRVFMDEPQNHWEVSIAALGIILRGQNKFPRIENYIVCYPS